MVFSSNFHYRERLLRGIDKIILFFCPEREEKNVRLICDYLGSKRASGRSFVIIISDSKGSKNSGSFFTKHADHCHNYYIIKQRVGELYASKRGLESRENMISLKNLLV